MFEVSGVDGALGPLTDKDSDTCVLVEGQSACSPLNQVCVCCAFFEAFSFRTTFYLGLFSQVVEF